MKDTSFLNAVAAACANHYTALHDVCFLFPNKRAGTFFLKALSNAVGKRVILAPEVLAAPEFMERVSHRRAASRIDLIFRLYKVYRNMIGAEQSVSSSRDLLDFDRFAPWAEILLSDFSEVDKYDADPRAVFKNVLDYRTISSNFLTEEQCDIIERYFGHRPSSAGLEGFWSTLWPEEERSELKRKFVELWKLLPALYFRLADDLEADGLAMPGSTYRLALQQVVDNGADALPWKKVVAVGFNSLTTCEARILAELRDLRDNAGEPLAEFFWDATGPILDPSLENKTPGGAKSRSVAAQTVWRNIRNFPSPEWAGDWIRQCDVPEGPAEIVIAAAPSNAAQTKIAAKRVSEWIEKFGIDELKAARAAVVIPDDNLLLPLVHSLPAGLNDVNLTLGYSMRYTAVASFIYHLRRVQSRARRTPGAEGYYHEDFKLFMNHPLVHVVIGSETANDINAKVAAEHRRIVSLDWIASQSETLARLLRPISRKTDVEEAATYVRETLGMVSEALQRAENNEKNNAENSAENSAEGSAENSERNQRSTFNRLERQQIAIWLGALERLMVSVRMHKIEMRPDSLFHLVDRLLAGETVTFEGEPLKGLQIMGLLETRALDFDHLIVLSMNDKVMPGRARTRTFIPEAIRLGYGLPSVARAEELYSYYFYRMLSRAKDVTLIYDARAGEGMRSGGKSRFLMQLSMLHARNRIREEVYTFGLNTAEKKAQEVPKTPKVMEMLESFTAKAGDPKARNLSASALMNYGKCPVLFYYKNVVGVKDEIIPEDYVDDITQGTIVHDAMLHLYLPAAELRHIYLENPVVLSRERLEQLHADHEAVAREVRRALNHNHFRLPREEWDRELTGRAAITAEFLEQMVRNLIECDIANAPIELVGGEIKGHLRYKAGEAPEVNFSYALDRVDICQGSMRIVDYKTGGTKNAPATMDDVFNGNKDAKYSLQLLLYSLFLEHDAPERFRESAKAIRPLLLSVNRDLAKRVVPLTLGKEPVTSHSEVKEEFQAGLERMLLEIFDPSIPFTPTQNPDSCTFCTLKYLCGRE